MNELLSHYVVIADSDTGEWLCEPKYVGKVDRDEWLAKTDFANVHYDTWERAGCDTCAITVSYPLIRV